MVNSSRASTAAPESSVGAQRTDNASLLRRLEFEQLLSEVSTCFIKLSAEEIDRHINQALGQVGSFLGFNLGAISKFSGQGSACEVTHIWTAAGLPPIPPGFTELDFPWASGSIAQGHEVHLTSLDLLPLEAQRDRQTYERFGLRSVYNWPLQVGRTVVGILSFASVAKAHGFPSDFEQGLKLLAQVMASSLARARDDRALRESEAKLSLAADAAGAGLWELNLASHSFWLTKKTRELFDFNSEEVVSFDRFLSVVHPDDQELIRRTLRKVVESKNEFGIEYRVLRPAGSFHWILSRGRFEGGGAERPDRLMGVSVDITARREAEEARRESEARLGSAVEVAGLGFYDMGCDPGQIFVDERLRSLLGLTPEDNHRVREFWIGNIHHSDRERVQELSRKVLGGQLAGATVEYRYQHPERGTLWFSHVSQVLERGPDGHAVRRLGVIRDITEEKHAQEALRDFSARLISAQEEERSRLARELHDDITQRLARLAIDVGRNEAGSSNPSLDETGRTVREELIRLSEDVHALSYRLHPSILEDLGLAAALKAEAERFERQGASAIELKVQALPDSMSPDVALCLFRVAQEALRNAARHSAAQTIKLSLRAVDGGLQLAVQDDGCGFDPAVQRDHPSLGLSSMQERVRLLSGELEIESAPGQGTTVLAWVPLGLNAKGERV